MKTRILWFLIGFIISWLLGGGIAAYRTMPVDLTRNWPQRNKEIVRDAEALSWMKSARGLGLGNYSLWVPSDKQVAAAQILPTEDPKSPVIWFHDSKRRGRFDEIVLIDAQKRTFSFDDKNGDGAIDSFSYSTGFNTNDISLYDYNMDGTYDSKFGEPNRYRPNLKVNIDGTWHELIHQKGATFVQTKAGLKRVVSQNGVWVLENSLNPAPKK
jgi:hypothetical protein